VTNTAAPFNRIAAHQTLLGSQQRQASSAAAVQMSHQLTHVLEIS
jgi:hypothetical protein